MPNKIPKIAEAKKPPRKSYTRTGIGQRIGQDTFYFEYRDGDIYVRRKIAKSLLTAFLTNGLDCDSNRGAGAQPIELETFLRDHYLPLCAAPRLTRNPESLNSEADLADALVRTLGQVSVHDIRSAHAEKHKAMRIDQGRKNTTIKKELLLLGRAMGYAMSTGLITKNLMPPVRGLPAADRSWIWLRTKAIEHLLESCPDRIRLLIEFLVLTGARKGEALLLQEGDINLDRRTVAIPTEKRKCPAREAMRTLKVDHLGPRLDIILSKMRPDSATGKYFPYSERVVGNDFDVARKKAGLDKLFPETGFHIHDLRGTFAVHRAMSGVAPRQLQYEMGHKNSASIEAYLGRAEEFDPEDSIFFVVAGSPQTITATPSMPTMVSDSSPKGASIRETLH
jgi:integrase